MRTEKPEPLLHTPPDQYCKNEQYKLASDMTRGSLHQDFRTANDGSIEDESEQLAKSHGIYLEYNRAKTGKEKDWMYMVRISIPGGGVFTPAMWRVFDDLSTRFTRNAQGLPSLRLTTRQNVQYHWIKKEHVVEVVREVAQTGFFTLNGCGDNVRNVMGCPLSRFSTVYDANAAARKFGEYFRLPAEPHIQVFEVDTSFIRTPEPGQHFEYAPNLLNRKFKIAFSAVHQDQATGQWLNDNCVELRTNEVGTAPVLNPRTGRVEAYMVYIGGGQGEKNGKATAAMLGKPFGLFTEHELLKGLDAIVKVHQEWGDRKNRHWARLKYVVQAQGIAWYQDQVRALGATFSAPLPEFDPGVRMLHHGWSRQPSNNLWAYGAYVENGRLIDRDGTNLKTMVRAVLDKHEKSGVQLMTTPNQDLLFVNIPPELKQEFESDLRSYGQGTRHGKPVTKLRQLSGACVGLDTCRLAYTESEQFEPELIDQLDARGYGEWAISIGITGCERQCFRPATKTIGLVGQGPDLYAVKLAGSEDGRHQGQYVSDGQRWYLRQVPRDKAADLCIALHDLWKKHARSGEDLGAVVRRITFRGVIEFLRQHPLSAPLMEKNYDAPYVPDEAKPLCGI